MESEKTTDLKDVDIAKLQNKMFEDLKDLKNEFNVVIRFHPQYYQSLLNNCDSVGKIVKDNFIVDYILARF